MSHKKRLRKIERVTNVCHECECVMSHENSLGKIECLPLLPSPLLLWQRDMQACSQTDRTERQIDKERKRDRPRPTLVCSLPLPNPLLPPSRISNIGTPSPSPTTLLFQKVVGQVAGTRIKMDSPPRVSFSACCFSNMSTMKVANIKGLLSVANLLLLLARALLLLLLHACTFPPSPPSL